MLAHSLKLELLNHACCSFGISKLIVLIELLAKFVLTVKDLEGKNISETRRDRKRFFKYPKAILEVTINLAWTLRYQCQTNK